jgi:hypothetical protein
MSRERPITGPCRPGSNRHREARRRGCGAGGDWRAGDGASWRYLEFFTANIRNPHTRRAYGRACARFFAWCARRRLGITDIRPFDVAAYVERLQEEAAAPNGGGCSMPSLPILCATGATGHSSRR